MRGPRRGPRVRAAGRSRRAPGGRVGGDDESHNFLAPHPPRRDHHAVQPDARDGGVGRRLRPPFRPLRPRPLRPGAARPAAGAPRLQARGLRGLAALQGLVAAREHARPRGHRARQRARLDPLPGGRGLHPRPRGLPALGLPPRPPALHRAHGRRARRHPARPRAAPPRRGARGRDAGARRRRGLGRHPAPRGDREPPPSPARGGGLRGRRPHQGRAPGVRHARPRARRRPAGARRPARGRRGADRHPLGLARAAPPHRPALHGGPGPTPRPAHPRRARRGLDHVLPDARGEGRRPARPRARPAGPGPGARAARRQDGAGLRGGGLHRLGALPSDRAPRARDAGAL